MTIPVYGWADLEMSVSGAATGGGTPSQRAFGPSGNIKQVRFGVNDSVYQVCHVPHDALHNADCYGHVHWSTDGTQVNSVKWQISIISAAGYNTEAFGADTVFTLEEAAAGVAWQHMITEEATPRPLPDIDSLIIIELKRISNGGTENTDDVFGLYFDLHYQIGQVATPNRSPDFFNTP